MTCRTRVPTLTVTQPDGAMRRTSSNADKAKAFREAFFPAPQLEQQVPLSNAQIERTFRRMTLGKATCQGTPTNDLLRNCADILVPYIGPLYRATFHLNYYPPSWALTETLVLRKPGKSDYQLPSSHRPIALSPGWSRGLNACITEEVQFECEKNGILPARHYGSRPGRSAVDARDRILYVYVLSSTDRWTN